MWEPSSPSPVEDGRQGGNEADYQDAGERARDLGVVHEQAGHFSRKVQHDRTERSLAEPPAWMREGDVRASSRAWRAARSGRCCRRERRRSRASAHEAAAAGLRHPRSRASVSGCAPKGWPSLKAGGWMDGFWSRGCLPRVDAGGDGEAGGSERA